MTSVDGGISTTWGPYITIMVVVIGGIVTFWAQVMLRRSDRKYERRALAAALRGEITGILTMTEKRQSVDSAKKHINRLEAGEDLIMPRIIKSHLTQEEIKGSYPIFFATVDRIGILGDKSAGKIAIFYTQLLGIVQTLSDWAGGDSDHLSPKEKATQISEELDLWTNTEAIGEELVKLLEKQ